MGRERSGIVLVLCAPSGTGKTTLTRRLLTEFPRFAFSVSYTTRKPRNGEVDGKDYHFVTVEAFLRLRDAGFFAEWAEVHGNFYGTPLKATLDLLDEGRDVLFDIDVQGARQLRASLQRGRYVFIMPPSRDELEHRLRARGTDDEETIARRLANAAKELREARRFDAWIVNDDLERAYDELRAAYIEETLSPECRSAFLDGLLQGWND
ncbi:guanylate kinase [Nitratidesulfovibrio vulgaris]|jgi:guanylate kinase|uniref:Guanylate kinase n=2 Tax=Nitratidesulfovibrio vulgaris TaxID=881 RepID=KGUA_NITV2|nr:guanylate kinase [Nitratidesulfovibrio vulgaris]Q72DM9.1 RecName: Full=Guanylate kinase; AltName: Full=GMP kinase [Nitratidesulfovibrio vulgaris str. Hildenborough]GEB81271.1 guanylate kinase [Desulfovibrio desulfuricans]HBW14729.1 guanylate kinase [Desulfovibrio sp.]AAS95380.1 guanylate kinase [Nitratidesulfovibrio vulgaris str. Hildenborough]ABM29100.1 guanylate kinase [Nitratidesulfovibrio vulgaris DP4]ADP85994.1 guanylate kinase [Nitratidesulfovibrio vulgaris RCH1]